MRTDCRLYEWRGTSPNPGATYFNIRATRHNADSLPLQGGRHPGEAKTEYFIIWQEIRCGTLC
jgi:hypothetical protein